MARTRITSDPDVAARTHRRPTGWQATRAGEAAAPLRDRPIRRSDRERRPLATALALSLAIHALLLSLTFGGDEFGLPGLAFPWRDRRIEVPDLRIVLAPAHVGFAEPAVAMAAEPLRSASIDPPRADVPVPGPPVSAALEPQGTAAATAATATEPLPAEAMPTEVAAATAPKAPFSARGAERLAPAQNAEPAAIDVQTSDGSWSVARVDRSAPASAISAAPSASSAETVPSATPDPGTGVQEAQREEAVRQEAAGVEIARLETERREAARVEVARLEAERQEAARQAAAQLEAERQQAARQEAARVEVARLEAERQEAARQAAAQLEAERQHAARQEAARVESARIEAERREAARQAAAQREAERQNVARQEAARVEVARLEAERQAAAQQAAAQLEAQRQAVAQQAAAQQAAAQLEAQRQALARQESTRPQPVGPEAGRQATSPQEAPRAEVEHAEARREAALRAIGRQLDEEADRRKSTSTDARPASTLPYSLSTARRVRLWGRTDPNVELVEYAEAWARKIQLNTVVETVRELVKRPHTPSMVTVAVRSDGSVESVTFVVSSGVAAIDEAIRRIVESQRPYPAFPRALAREFDVIEIRRTWYFDSGIRLQ